ATRTPTRTSTAFPTAYPGNVALNEYLPRPASDWNGDGEANSRDEYIELINMGTVSINIRNWKLDDIADGGSSPYTLPDLTLAPYQIVRFYASQTGISLSDGGDTVRLIKPDGKTADLQNYTIVTASDRTWCRLPDGNGAWAFECRPTPGRPNARAGSEPPGRDEEQPEVLSTCLLPDTVPQAFWLAECGSSGGNVWERKTDPELWLENHWKWSVFVE
ncbi:MAG: lamin tail domain-containing protein, partial [Chloroflexi bacterium]|nr:lamin tail domain-containing protein [Chloroflexota bacterium]